MGHRHFRGIPEVAVNRVEYVGPEFFEGLGLSMYAIADRRGHISAVNLILMGFEEDLFHHVTPVTIIPPLGRGYELSHSGQKRSVMIFSSVKKLTTAFPWALISAKREAFMPPKGRYATGAGMPTFTPIIPACASSLNFLAL